MEVCDHLPVDLPDVVDVAEDRLAHHVVAIAIEVDILHESLLGVLVGRLKLLPDCVLLHLEVIAIVDAVAEHVAEDLHRLRDAVWEAEGVVERVLA